MKHPLRTLAMCSAVLLVSACANTVAGTAEVNSAVVLSSSAPSSGPASLPDPTGGAVTPTPESAPGQSSAAQSTPAEQSTAAEQSTPVQSSPAVQSTSIATSAPTTTASTTSVPATTQRVSRPTKLSCPAGALTAKGGSFCFQIPAGFVDGSSTATYPGTDPVRTAIQLKGTGETRDLIFVTSSTLDIDSDALGDAVIKASLAKALSANTSAAGITPVTQSTVAGDRAFETTLKFTDGVQQRYLIIFAATHRVSVSCQWHDHAASIAAACKSVLASLQIKNP